MAVDKFGITKLVADGTGIQWYSNWGNGKKRTLKGKGTSKTDNKDPNDSMSFFHCVGKQGNEMTIDGKGICRMKGEHPRLYVGDMKNKFNNVEVTCYVLVKKCMIKSGSYTTFRLAGRSNHHATAKCKCNGKGYAAECFVNQSARTFKDSRFRKELLHPHYANKGFTSGHANLALHTNWFGMKFVLQTSTSTGEVTSKCYTDVTNGAAGGTWVLKGTQVDNGTNWAITAAGELAGIASDIASCKKGCLDKKPAGPPYQEKVTRPGYCCYLRTDFVSEICFKWFSAREIAPLA
jgi:hypothetical protein